MTVLDSSALLAFLLDEPGSDLVAERLTGSVLGAANLAEVVDKLVDLDVDQGRLMQLLGAAGVAVEPLTAEDARLAGALRTVRGGRGLSLGDRCCLALAVRRHPATVLTADRAWADLDLPITVELVR